MAQCIYRKNPTDRFGCYQIVDSSEVDFNYFSEVDDKGYLCTKTMAYWRQCFLLGIEPNKEKEKELEALDDQIWENSPMNKKLDLPSPDIDFMAPEPIEDLIEVITDSITKAEPKDDLHTLDDYFLEVYDAIVLYLRAVTNTTKYEEGHAGRAPIAIQNFANKVTTAVCCDKEEDFNIMRLSDPEDTYIKEKVTPFEKELGDLLEKAEKGELKVLPNIVCSMCGAEEDMSTCFHEQGDLTELQFAKHYEPESYIVTESNDIICRNCLYDMKAEDVFDQYHTIKRSDDFDYDEILVRIVELSETLTEAEILEKLK